MSVQVSIIIPIYNAEKYLAQCIESAMGQTLKDIEIILINDGSKDESEKICKRYAERDSRIIYYCKENEGLAAARQDGIERSTGEYIGFIDSDDWVEADMYEKMYKVAKRTDSDVILCNCFEYNEKKQRMGIAEGTYEELQIKDAILPRTLIDIDKRGSRSNIRWSNCLRIYKRKTIEDNGIKFDRRFRRCQDLPFTFDAMLYAKRFYYLDEFLYHNRQDAGSLSRGYTKNMWRLIKPLIEYIRDAAVKRDGYDLSQQAATTSFFLCIDCIMNEFKSDAPRYLRKARNIQEVLNDKVCVEALKNFEATRLNGFYYKIFYKNMKKRNSGKLVWDYYYYKSNFKKYIGGPIMKMLTENAIYAKLRK